MFHHENLILLRKQRYLSNPPLLRKSQVQKGTKTPRTTLVTTRTRNLSPIPPLPRLPLVGDVGEEEVEAEGTKETREDNDYTNPLPSSSFPVGGRLQRYWQTWVLQDVEPWVQEVLHKGYQIPFLCSPPPLTQPIQFKSYDYNSNKAQALQESIEAMITKGAIELVKNPNRGFYSRMFVVPKSSGGWRPVIDLSPFNTSVLKTTFRMETPKTVLDSLLPKDWFVAIDLKDAYFQIPMHQNSKKFLRFVWQGQTYQFRVLCPLPHRCLPG